MRDVLDVFLYIPIEFIGDNIHTAAPVAGLTKPTSVNNVYSINIIYAKPEYQNKFVDFSGIIKAA